MTDSFVLYVEDSRLCAMVTSEILRDHGFDVVGAYNADDAYEVLGRPKAPLALVTDINLGDGPNGYDIARRARAAYPNIPVVYVSGSAVARHLIDGVADSEFIAKPFRRQRIVEALNRVIEHEAATDRAAAAAFLGLSYEIDVIEPSGSSFGATAGNT